jgi:serine/threonine-protein kinase
VVDAGKQLAVDYILEGSVLRDGQHVRINTQLIRVRDDFPLWSARYDRELTDIFAIQDEISRGMVNSLRLKFGRGRRRYETSIEAYDLYLRARALPIQRSLIRYEEIIGPLEAVIAKDALFAPAYADLAVAHAARSGVFLFDRAKELAKMRATAEEAVRLDPLLAESFDALGMAYARDARWEQAEKSFRRAIELDHNRSEIYSHFAYYYLLVLGRVEDALLQLRVAEKNDPLSPAVHFELAYVLRSVGRYDEAAGYCQKDPGGSSATNECLGRVRLSQGRIEEAMRLLKTALDQGVSPGSEVPGFLGYAYGRAGRREQAEKLAESSWLNPLNQALIFAGLGDKDRTFAALDRAAPAGPLRIGKALTFPEFTVLRGDPRVRPLRKKVSLPE